MAQKQKKPKKQARVQPQKQTASTPKAKRRPRARHIRRETSLAWLYSLVSGLIMIVCVAVACLIFFQVETVTVEGTSRYSDNEIITAAGLESGENLFFINTTSIANTLEKSLPYLTNVTIERTLPGSVTIEVEETSAVAVLTVANGYWYIDASGKLLELRTSDNGLPHITGVSLVTPTQGTVFSVDTAYRTKRTSVIALLTALESQGLLADLISIDLSDGSQLSMQYTEKYIVKIPYGADFDYRVRAMSGIIDNLTGTNDLSYGVIDMTLESEWHFIPES